MYTSDRSTRFSTLPPAPSTSPGWATRNCTRPSRGATSCASCSSASMRATVATAASTDEVAPVACALAAATAAWPAATWALAASSAACWLRTRARSSSSSWPDDAPSFSSVVERARRRWAASSSAARAATWASAARTSLSRSATWARAVSTPFLAWAWRAAASSRCACRLLMSMRASGWPALTKAPSSTRMACTRPGSLVATSTSVASMRPLPLMKPSPGPLSRWLAQ